MRALVMTGMVTASMIFRISSGSLIRATPPWARMSAGTRSSAITAHAPASSAILAWSAVTTSMITPPFNICASPFLILKEPVSCSIQPPLLPDKFSLILPRGEEVDGSWHREGSTDHILISGKIGCVHKRHAHYGYSL